MIKLFKNKKADFIGLNVMIHILEIIYLITVAVSIMFIVHVDKKIDTFPIESEIFFNRILYSNNGLWVYDEEIERLYPGVLELENFQNKNKIENSLSKSMFLNSKNQKVAAELILEYDKEKTEPIYYNEQEYKEWVEWYKAGVTEGIGTRKGKNKKFPIFIKKGEELILAQMDITLLITNT